jgi:hypothetical protein
MRKSDKKLRYENSTVGKKTITRTKKLTNKIDLFFLKKN